MILLPNKEYSQRFLDELNYIGYAFLESATEYFINETDKDYLRSELKNYFPASLVNADVDRCFDILRILYVWLEDDYYHFVTRLHEYVLMRAIHNKWMLFNDLPEEDALELRESFYSLSGKVNLSEVEMARIRAMKNDEFTTMKIFFENFNFGELELITAFHQEGIITFLRF